MALPPLPSASRISYTPASASAPDLLATLEGEGEGEGDEATGEKWERQTRSTPLGLGLVTPDRTPSPEYERRLRKLSVTSEDYEQGARVMWEEEEEIEQSSRRPLPARGQSEPEGGEEDTDGQGQETPERPAGRFLRRHASESYSLASPSSEREPYVGDGTDPLMTRSDIFLSPHTPQAHGEPASPRTPLSPSIVRDTLAGISFSLWDYLHREVVATDEVDGANSSDLRAERVNNFLNVPVAIEKIVIFGSVICFDAFLHTFTILPLRVAVAGFHMIANYVERFVALMKNNNNVGRRLKVSHKVDLIKGLLVVLSCIVLHRITDASQMYHSVRGQETIKLYVIFNVLEIADRLCCSFGQDVLDSLFSRSTLARRTDGSQPHLRPIVLFALAFVFTVAHTLVLVYQLVTLNVAINSYDNSLLTLLLSNQFVEIKGAVFKKFEKENLFQMSCADIVERFQLFLMLVIITFRNLVELSGSTFSHLPTSFALFPSLSLIQTIFTPAATVLGSEMVVDWLKHAFITKFNHIRPSVYGRFMDVLCKDLVAEAGDGVRKSQPFVDQSPIVSRRLGFAVLPFGCLIVRVVYQAIDMLSDVSHIDECSPPSPFPVRRGVLAPLLHLPADISAVAARWGFVVLASILGWCCLVALKLLIGINLRAYAAMRYATMGDRAKEDRLNGKDREPIGVGKEERRMEGEIKGLIDRGEFDVAGKPSKGIRMEELGRFDMTRSRIW